MSKLTNAQIKEETLRLYRSLPQDAEERKKRLDVRDRVIELNYTFFGYIASHTYIANTSVSYEDKFQSALMHFCECWWWYLYEAKYRTDLSFGVFFKPRISEMIERELTDVKYSIRRSLCMEAGEQLGKHWAKVRYEDIKDVKLSPDKMCSLKAIFGNMYWADLETHALFIPAPSSRISEFDNLSDNYDTIEELLIHEMVEQEKDLKDSDLVEMSEMLGISYKLLKEAYPIAKAKLYQKLQDNLDLYDV